MPGVMGASPGLSLAQPSPWGCVCCHLSPEGCRAHGDGPSCAPPWQDGPAPERKQICPKNHPLQGGEEKGGVGSERFSVIFVSLFFFSCLFPFHYVFGLISLEWVRKEQLGMANPHGKWPNLSPTPGTWNSQPRQGLQTWL